MHIVSYLMLFWMYVQAVISSSIFNYTISEDAYAINREYLHKVYSYDTWKSKNVV